MTKAAIVTGASRGMGKGIALALAKLNYQVILIARNLEKLKQTAKEITEQGHPNPLFYSVNVENEKEVNHALQDALKKTKKIDVLVTAAGILFPGTTDLSSENFQKTLEVNILGTFHCIKAVINSMKAQRSGHIINVASRAGKVGIEKLGGYCASKFGIMGLNDSLALEMAKFGINVTALCPGFTDTDMAAGGNIPKEERIPISDITKVIEFLLSLSPQSIVREVTLECRKTIVLATSPSLE